LAVAIASMIASRRQTLTPSIVETREVTAIEHPCNDAARDACFASATHSSGSSWGATLSWSEAPRLQARGTPGVFASNELRMPSLAGTAGGMAVCRCSWKPSEGTAFTSDAVQSMTLPASIPSEPDYFNDWATVLCLAPCGSNKARRALLSWGRGAWLPGLPLAMLANDTIFARQSAATTGMRSTSECG